MENNIVENTLLKTVKKNRIDSFQQSFEKAKLKINLTPELQHNLSNILLFSEFIASSFIKRPQIFYDLIKSNDFCKSYSKHTYIARLKKSVSKDMDLTEIKTIFLQIKLYETIRIAWRDLTKKAELEETLEDISNLADAIIDSTMSLIYNEICKSYGVPVDHEGNFQHIIVLGMGKLGAHELNFSSDLDLIFVYLET